MNSHNQRIRGIISKAIVWLAIAFSLVRGLSVIADPFDQFRQFNLSKNTEVVMKPGSTIAAQTTFGKISILAASPVLRRYTVDGQTREQKLSLMEKRSHGVLGINSTSYFSGYQPGLSGGQMTISGMEGQVNFRSESDFHQWMDRFWGRYAAYNNHGIVVGWYYTPQPNSNLVVQVFRACIKGEPVDHLSGANDKAVTVSPGETALAQGCARVLVTDQDMSWPKLQPAAR